MNEMAWLVLIIVLLAVTVIFWSRRRSSDDEPANKMLKETRIDLPTGSPQMGSQYVESQYAGSQHIDPHQLDPRPARVEPPPVESSQEDSSDVDQGVLDQLREAGSDLRKPHAMEFYLYFPTQESARKVATEIENDGFTVEVKTAPQGSHWLCYVTKRMVPERAKIAATGKRFKALAKKFDGEYGGWETSVEK
jgi:hypothetical protein